MRFLFSIASHHFQFAFCRRFSASSSSSLWKTLRQVPYYYRKRVFLQAQDVLAEYFHSTRALPFCHAEQIAVNSPSCLYSLLSDLPFSSPSDFPHDFRRHLAYRLINEFDFFFESIGVSPELNPYHGQSSLSLSEDSRLLSTFLALVQFGFPWTRLGVLYEEKSSIFYSSGEELIQQLQQFERFGLDKVCLIGICLAFPSVLARNAEWDVEIEPLFRDLKCILGYFDSGGGSMEENVDAYFWFCRRIKVFYDLGCKKGEMGELMKNCMKLFLKLEEQELIRKTDFFCRLGMEKEEVGALLLRQPEILEFDLESPDIMMPDYLVNAGFSDEELEMIQQKYPYSMGRNKLVNLPELLKALILNKWLIWKIRDGDIRYLSPDYIDVAKDNEMDAVFRDGFEGVKAVRREIFLPTKLEFLQGIGFGQNKITVRALHLLMGTRTQLQERFDCLLGMGIEYSVLCRMVSASPKILNQSPDMLQKKVHFLCSGLGLSVQYLDSFPAFLSFDLENRIKPRYRMLDWLRDKGFLKKQFSPATVISTSENKYIGFLKESHPAAPKQWLEVFKYKKHSD